MIFSCSGGAGKEATKFLKALAEKLSSKKQEQYSNTVSYIRRRVRFDVLRTSVISFRGERRTQAQRKELRDIEYGLQNMAGEE